MSSFPSADGTLLHEMTWGPEAAAAPGGTIVIVHGYGEHIARYDALAQKLVAAGYRVHGCDLRGHGQSKGARGHVQRFDEYLEDVDALVARARIGAHRIFFIGHSMGGLIITRYVLRQGAAGLPLGGVPLGGIVISSPFYKLKLAVPPLKLLLGRLMSRIWPTLGLPSGLKGADVTRDPAIARIYDTDPLNNKNATARWFTEASAAQDDVWARTEAFDAPCFLIHGEADHVADPVRTSDVEKRLGSSDKRLKLYPGQFHELFNELEPERSRTIAEVIDWLEQRKAPTSA